MEQEEVWIKRKKFYQNILDNLFREPLEIDKILDQAKYFIKPNNDTVILDEKTGDLAIEIKGNFFGIDFKMWYSIWQVGKKIKIGINLLDHSIMPAFVDDNHTEVIHIWGDYTEPKIDTTHDGIFYDWEFNEPDLYQSYLNQETYILGVRHMHFRALRIVHDYLQKITNNGDKKDDFLTISI